MVDCARTLVRNEIECTKMEHYDTLIAVVTAPFYYGFMTAPCHFDSSLVAHGHPHTGFQFYALIDYELL